jgi:hypothetical protein
VTRPTIRFNHASGFRLTQASGSALGLKWARHEDRVRGLSLMEFIHPIPTLPGRHCVQEDHAVNAY